MDLALIGTYDFWLVVLSFFVATLAALGALMIAQRLTSARKLAWAAWLTAGSVSMGGGIWAMHFIGMLAFSLPCGVSYNVGVTMLSAFPGMLASGVALSVISRTDSLGSAQMGLSAVLMGAGIGAMHYAGMAAMELDAFLRYDARMVLVSVVVAVGLAYVSLSIRGRGDPSASAGRRAARMVAAAAAMGAAVAGMHYTAMRAAVFFPADHPSGVGATLEPTTLAILLVVFAVSVAMTTMTAAFAGQQLETSRALREEIDRRAALESESKAGEARLQAIFDTVVDGLITIDARGVVQRWSPSAARMFGYEAAEIVGRNVSNLMPEPDRSAHDGYLRHFLGTGEAKIIGIGRETTGRRKNGETFPLELSISQVRLGAEVFFTGIVRDVTERKRVLRELEEAVRGADAANRAKSAFVANVSHEIRTPLNAIIGMAHILMRGTLPIAQRDQAGKILQAGRSLLSIINDILDFSKIEAGQIAVENIPLDLERVLRDVTDMVGERAAAKGLELVLDLDQSAPRYLTGDPLRLGQILLNYVNNAIKFTEIGEIKMTVACEERAADRIKLRFSVADTGVGLSDEAKSRLFQPFQQADVSTTRRYGGTGLGLVICKRLAELMGGDVGVESREGAGSVFWFTATLGAAAEDVEQRSVPALGLRGRRALVVEDNDSTREVIVAMLRSMTFDVAEAADGPRAVAQASAAIAEGKPFDIAFVDWRLPGMDGLETAAAIRRLTDGVDVPAFVLVTAYGGEEILHRAAKAGVDEVLVKPVSPSSLLDAAARALGMLDGGAVASATTEGGEDARLTGVRVLVAEDNALNQEVVSELLSSAGAIPDLVANGSEALERLATRKYDIVLMDMQMPVMDGLTAARRIRENPALDALPVIALTANAMDGDRRACLDAGMNDHLAKPIDPEELYAMVARWGGRRPRPSAAVSAGDLAGKAAAIQGRGVPPPFDALTPELDPASALKRVLHKADMYRAMLIRFRADQHAAADKAKAALAAGDSVALEMIAHAAKGLAGQIGAPQLARIAADLEQAARNRDCGPKTANMVDDLADALARTLAAIDRALPPADVSPAPAAPVVLSYSAAAAESSALARLTALLADDDAEAQQYITMQASALRGALGDAAYGRVSRAVERFDFDDALSIVRSSPTEPAA